VTHEENLGALILAKFGTYENCFNAWKKNSVEHAGVHVVASRHGAGVVAASAGHVLLFDDALKGLQELHAGVAEKQLRRLLRKAADVYQGAALSYRGFVMAFSPKSRRLEEHLADVLVNRYGTLANAFTTFCSRQPDALRDENRQPLLAQSHLEQELAPLELGLSKLELNQVCSKASNRPDGHISLELFERVFADSESQLLDLLDRASHAIIRKYKDLDRGFDMMNHGSVSPCPSSGC